MNCQKCGREILWWEGAKVSSMTGAGFTLPFEAEHSPSCPTRWERLLARWKWWGVKPRRRVFMRELFPSHDSHPSLGQEGPEVVR